MENIINKLKHLGKPLAENKNEKKVEEIVDNILFPILIKDRTTRDLKGNGGFDFLAKDKAIHQQLLPKLEELYKKPQIIEINHNEAFLVKIDEQFWNELFCLEKGIEKHEKDDKDIKLFFDKYIDKLVEGGNKKQIFDLSYWGVFINKKDEWIENIVKKYFIKGENNFENMADICLFAVLIQFFEGPFLNIPQLDYFFRLKGSSNNVGSTSQVYNQKEKGKEIIQNEEELNGIVEDGITEIEEVKKEVKEIVENKGFKIEYEDDRINILFNFVQNMKRKLGFNEESDWQNLRESPWELNYEPEDFSPKRYNGPFQLETDELLGINKLIGYNKCYICNIGREYSIEDGDECYNKYIKKFKNQKKIFWSIMRETYIGPFEFKKAKSLKKDFLNAVETLCSEVIKIVNNTVEEINFEKINGNVRNAIIIAEEREAIKD
uniref:Uncharacterized protein n=1 Tax=Meloidogyne enterolobii TaxID=390850 RepID=A0A6V7XP97_MELEN|nr:unnamed protein product [Meloidogyne enterolobii]